MINKEPHTTFTLDNGMRVIHILTHSDVAYCGIAIDAGTRDERADEHGMAHFCEHILFKGTRKRKAWHILNRMDSVGGDLNAYTNKEEIMVYAAFMKEHLDRAVELLADIVFNSTFPQHEINKEREVIIEEIKSYKDSPAELIFDEFEDIIFAHHPLGHGILGEPEAVRRYGSEDAFRFSQRLFVPENTVFFVAGKYAPERVVTTIRKHCVHLSAKVDDALLHDGDTRGSVLHGNKWRQPLSDYSPQKITRHKKTHQAHVMIGCRAYPSNDPKRIALYFLNNLIAGPGMNSILNLALREHTGLVYTVESALTNYTDTGTFSVYFGCEKQDVEKCIDIIMNEFRQLAEAPLSSRRIQAALKQITGQIGVACDNMENYALDTAKAFLHYNRFEGINDTLRHLRTLTPELLQQVADELFREDHLSMLIYR